MKSLQQSIVIAFVFAFTIVCLHHIGELAGWFAVAFIGFGGSQWAMSQVGKEETVAEQVTEESGDKQVVLPEQVFSLLEKKTEELTGTDLWAEMPQSDAVEIEPPTQIQTEEAPKEIQFQLLMQQLESLPQKQGRRKVWAVLCDRLHVKGGTKVRDANLANKAKFLEAQKVKVPELIKAKVVALRAA